MNDEKSKRNIMQYFIDRIVNIRKNKKQEISENCTEDEIKMNEIKEMYLGSLQEMDLVLCENGALYWVLFNPAAESLALYNYTFYPVVLLNGDYFEQDLTCVDNQYTINKVLRSNTKWYIMNRMREYEQALESGTDVNAILESSRWKWSWKRNGLLEGAITTDKLESMVVTIKSEDWLSDITRDKVYTGSQIKEEIKRLLDAPFIVRKGKISADDVLYFNAHYIESEYPLSNFKYYVLYFGRYNIVAKKVDVLGSGEIVWDLKR